MLYELFTLIIYQPFFNILVFLYWMLDILTGGKPDMGVAVILLTLVIRLILLPISMMQNKSEHERRGLAERMKELERELADDPVALRKAAKQLFRDKPAVVIGSLFSLVVQIAISLMLWRIFSTGLEGKDLHLLYPFMPDVHLPFNLVFWGKFDLAHPDLILNLIQSLLIFVLETLSMNISPYPITRNEVVRMQLVLPIVSFFIFMFLPAGKKLFVITTLSFSIVLTFFKFVSSRFEAYKIKAEASAQKTEETVVVDVK